MAQEAFRVIQRRACATRRKVALGEVVLGGTGEPRRDPAHAADGHAARDPARRGRASQKGSAFFGEIEEGEVDPDQLGARARADRARKTAPFDPKRFKDDYEAALRELIEAKVGHRADPRRPAPVAPKAARVVDLMEALKRSLKDEKAAAGRRAAKKAPSRGPPPRCASCRASR